MINVINHPITIDLANKINMITNYQIKKNDNNSHKFVFTILNNSVAYDLTGQTVKIYFQKLDTNKVFLDCTIDDALNGKLSSLLDTQCLSYAGAVATEITFYGTNGEILTSITFNFTVVNSIRDDAAIQSSSEFTALTNALVTVNQYDSRITSVETSLADMTTKQGDITLLNTTDKSSAVNAINEVKTQANSNTTSIANNATAIANIGNASPKGTYATLSALQTAFPTGTTGICLVTADGKWYYWNGSAWTVGGTYQSTGIANNSVNNPSLQKGAVDLTRTNFSDKTILATPTMELGSINAIDGTLIASTTFMRTNNYIPVTPNTTYILEDNKGYQFRVINFNSSNGVISYTSGVTCGASFTTPTNCTQIKLATYAVSGDNDITDIVNILSTLKIKDSFLNPAFTANIADITNIKNDVVNEINKVEYAHKFIYYNPADYSINVIGDDIGGDNRIAVFYKDGVTYTIQGLNGAKKVLSANSGNAWIVVDKNTITASNITINDMTIVTTVLSNHIALAHLVWNSSVNSKIIKNYKDLGVTIADIPILNTTGEPINFLKEMLSTNKQVYKISIYGDSIFASGFKDRTYPDGDGKGQYEQPPRNCNLDSMQRMIYDYLNFNKPTFRNELHTDWSFPSGACTNSSSAVMPNGNSGGVGNATQWEQLKVLNDVAVDNIAQINVTGKDTCVFVFEGGVKTAAEETGKVNITVSVNGGAFVNPSTVLKGKLNKKGYGDAKVYDSALDTFDTSFTADGTITANNKYCPMIELFYSTLNPANTYTFKITRPIAEKPVRLWGCYYFTGQTLIIHNESKPGFSWNNLSECVYSDLELTNTDYVILEAPMYHDWVLSTAQTDATNLINKIKNYGIQIALCSCSPGGVIPIGRLTTILGDQNGSSYWAGEHFYNYYKNLRYFNTTNITGTRPSLHDIYSVTINSVTYNLEVVNDSGVSTGTYFDIPDNFPDTKSLTFPLTFTKVSGNASSQASIVYSSVNSYFTMEQHRTMILQLCRQLNCNFIDVFQAFVDIAKSVGETLTTPAYNMDSGHPLYSQCVTADADNSNYPSLSAPYQMNYMSNFFDVGDGHHLQYNAHSVIFELIKNQVLRDCAFKTQ